MNRSDAKLMMEDIKNALKGVASKYNMTLKTKGGSFDDLSFSPKIEFVGTDSSGNSKAKIDFERYAEMFGLKAEWFGKSVRLNNGESAKIIELKTRSRKYPILVETSYGKKFKLAAHIVKFQLS